jgi:hypothetical protein
MLRGAAKTDRSARALLAAQLLLAGSFAFDIVDRLSGASLGLLPPAQVDPAALASGAGEGLASGVGGNPANLTNSTPAPTSSPTLSPTPQPTPAPVWDPTNATYVSVSSAVLPTAASAHFEPDWLTTYIVAPLMNTPGLWFLVNMLWMLLVLAILLWWIQRQRRRTQNGVTVKIQVRVGAQRGRTELLPPPPGLT